MSVSEGFLYRTMAFARKAIDEPSVNSKYDDDELITIIENEYLEVLLDVTRTSQATTKVEHTITLGSPSETRVYALPPTVGTIVELELLSADDQHMGWLRPRSSMNPTGYGYRLEGNALRIQSGAYAEACKIKILYIPDRLPKLHYGTAEAISSTSITLAETPTAGSLDMRSNAYAGSIIRILDATTNYVMQERTLTVYDPQTRVGTFGVALSPVPAGTVVYEIAPVIDRVVDFVVALAAARLLLVLEGQEKRAKSLDTAILRRKRNIRLKSADRDSYAGLHWDPDSAMSI